MMTLKNLLVATDFGDASTDALAHGREIARMFGATLHLVHVVDNVAARISGGVDGYVHDLAELQQGVEQNARTAIDALLTDDDRAALSARAVLLTATGPAAAIVDYAGHAGIDLIVVGTHGRGGMAHLLLGSVAERVVRTAPCPVLTVKPAPGG